MTNENELDIRAAADRAVSLFERQRTREAIEALNREREGQPTVVQEALDRYVAGRADAHLDRLRGPGALDGDDRAAIMPTLDRMQAARNASRFPSPDEMAALPSDTQRYDVYASIVIAKGTDASDRALSVTGERVILGLRQENSTFASATRDNPTQARRDDPNTPNVDESRKGTGVYDDRIVVLWRDAQGQRHLQAFDRSNTEPTAQYDHHAGADGVRRQFASNRAVAPRLDATEGYEDVVRPRKIQGVDSDRDGVRDLGRMSAGTVEMMAGRHDNPASAGDERAFVPSRNYPERAQRDTNADGWFTATDIHGVQNLDRSFKIHSGSTDNTDSAGCQTIHPHDYRQFMEAARGNPEQTRWQYVLVDTTPGMFRDVNREQDPGAQAPDRARDAPPREHPNERPHDPRMPDPAGRRAPPQDGPEPPDERRAPPAQRGAMLITEPDHIAHPTWLRAQTAMARLEPGALDGLDAQQRERLTAHVAARVLGDTQTHMTDITRIDASTRTDPNTGRPLGLIPGQGDPNEPQYKRLPVDIALAIGTPVERSSEIAKSAVETREQMQAQTLAQAQAINQDGPTMRMGGRALSGREG